MSHSAESIERPRRRRILIIVGITAIVEIGLALLGHFGPAMAHLLKPVYVIVAVVGLLTLWHAWSRDPDHTRRHGERRRG